MLQKLVKLFLGLRELLNELKKLLPVMILNMIYNSLILPKLHYDSDSIFKIQKKVVRNTSNSKYSAHAEPIFKDLRIPILQDMVTLKTLSFYYKHTHKELPQYFQNFSRTTNKTYTATTPGELRNYTNVTQTKHLQQNVWDPILYL